MDKDILKAIEIILKIFAKKIKYGSYAEGIDDEIEELREIIERNK